MNAGPKPASRKLRTSSARVKATMAGSRRSVQSPTPSHKQEVQPTGIVQSPHNERMANLYADRHMRDEKNIGRNLSALAGGGRPLPATLHDLHAEKLGTRLDQVRVHDDEQSHAAADRLGARAFVDNGDIRLGRNAPASGHQRDALIAHELAHVAQPDTDGKQSIPQLSPDLSLTPSVPSPEVFRSDIGISVKLYFSQGSFLLGAGGLRALKRVQSQLRMMPDAVISIDGYASAEGTEAFNQSLSDGRRQTVRTLLLTGLGFSPDVSGAGFGETQGQETGIDAADREKFRARNRRVEITIVSPALLSSAQPDEPDAPEPAQPFNLYPRLPRGPETDDERLNRVLTTPMVVPPPVKFSVCGTWHDTTRKWFDRRLRDIGVGESIRGRLVSLGVGAIEKLPMTAIEQALKANEVGKTERKAIMSAVRAACRQEISR